MNHIKIVLIGSGRVGFHLGNKLHEVGFNVIQVFSRQKKKAKELAQLIDSKPINNLSKISKEGDLYILAISDNAISKVSKTLSKLIKKNALIVHTSGATPISVFEKHFKRFGILYPLQTFSFEKKPDFSKIPICIDSQKKKDLNFLKKLALKISPNVHHLSDLQRSKLHVSAVFVNNFVNHLYFIGKKILDEENISLNILKPLIIETSEKILENDPINMQTGPAIRKDTETIKSHLVHLEKNPELQEIYQIITQSIQKYHS